MWYLAVAVGFLFVVYTSIVAYGMHLTEQLRAVRKAPAQEFVAIYRSGVPVCFGATYMTGQVLAPASCVAADGTYYAAIERASGMDKPPDRHAVDRITVHPLYVGPRSPRFNIAKLDIRHLASTRYAVAKGGEVKVRLGRHTATSLSNATLYCQRTPPRWIVSHLAGCQPLRTTSGLALEYPLGFVDLSSHGGAFHLVAFNAPPMCLGNHSVSFSTPLAPLLPWLQIE